MYALIFLGGGGLWYKVKNAIQHTHVHMHTHKHTPWQYTTPIKYILLTASSSVRAITMITIRMQCYLCTNVNIHSVGVPCEDAMLPIHGHTHYMVF